MRGKYGQFVAGVIVGGILFSGGAAYAAGIMAEHAPQTAYVDGNPVQLEAYNINGYNYVKLRDIGQAVGFNVYWDGKSIQVDTNAPYTGMGPTTSPSGQTGITLTDNWEVRQEMIQLINQVRKENGVPELPMNNALMDAAQEISMRQYIKHHNREECETVIAYGYPHGFGSNLTVFAGAVPAYIAQIAVRNWVNSPGHFRAMIDPRCDCIGVGVTISGGTTYCQMFVGNPNTHNPYEKN